jgi:DNA-binding NarL/FixJ family response regulator
LEAAVKKRLRILLADDHALIRRGARGLLQGRDGWKVVGEATNGTQAVEKAKRLKPDVAIVDISMPELDGVQVTRQIREALPNTKVLVLTMHDSDQMVQHALDAGAHGYVLKSDLTESLVEAVKNVAAGKRSLTPKVSEIVLKGFLKAKAHKKSADRADAQPTSREIQIIRFLAEGKVNKEIAYQLGIAVRTVEAHRAHVMQKLGLHSLADLIHYALRHGIASAPTEPQSI